MYAPTFGTEVMGNQKHRVGGDRGVKEFFLKRFGLFFTETILLELLLKNISFSRDCLVVYISVFGYPWIQNVA